MIYPDCGKELLRLLPKVLRARDFRLYLEGGKRLVDLWRWGGRAVLGHKPPKVLADLKNAAERGLFTPLPHPLERRVINALGNFFPNRAVRLYMDERSRERALAASGFIAAHAAPPCDPAFPCDGGAYIGAKSGVSLWRPFLAAQENPDREQCDIMLPVLPSPTAPAALILNKNIEDLFPGGDIIPPVLLAPAARALYNLAAALKHFPANRNWPEYPKIRKALSSGIWRRQGIYITAKPDTGTEEYETIFRRFLEGGFLIPPSPCEPIILPLAMSAGEEAKLAELLGGAHKSAGSE
ncbi:MAG: hypothetical protein FWC65_01480 [Treponema sp.]|nr:hypothetical protein [Treponema sp.]